MCCWQIVIHLFVVVDTSQHNLHSCLLTCTTYLSDEISGNNIANLVTALFQYGVTTTHHKKFESSSTPKHIVTPNKSHCILKITVQF